MDESTARTVLESEEMGKNLVEEYDSGKLEIALKKLLDQQRPIYRSIGA